MRFKNFKKVLLTLQVSILCLVSVPVFAEDIQNQEQAPQEYQIATVNELYPIEISETIENDYNVIVKTYAISPDENPNNIPRGDFSKYNERYIFSEIVRRENSANNKIQHTETVTINTKSQNMESILSQLAQEMKYDKDGYTGVLKLDISSIKTEVAGYTTKTNKLSATREYPNLSNNDTSSIPKSISQNGVTYNLVDVKFVADQTELIDYEEIPSTYKAIASYSATGKSTNATGYVTTANYSGEISSTYIDKIIYKVYFLSENPVGFTSETEDFQINSIGEDFTDINNELDYEDSDSISDGDSEYDRQVDNIDDEISRNANSINIKDYVIPISIIVLGMGSICGLIILFKNASKKNTIYLLNYNRQKRRYKRFAKANFDLKKNGIEIDLDQYSDKIKSPSFIVDFSRRFIENLFKSDKDHIQLVINYNGEEHVEEIDVNETMTEQYEINFSGKKKTTTEDDDII